MANWTKVFRFSHTILVPTSVNDSKPMLFGLDTGAFTNILSLRVGRQIAKVSSDYRDRVGGLNGRGKQSLQFRQGDFNFRALSAVERRDDHARPLDREPPNRDRRFPDFWGLPCSGGWS